MTTKLDLNPQICWNHIFVHRKDNRIPISMFAPLRHDRLFCFVMATAKRLDPNGPIDYKSRQTGPLRWIDWDGGDLHVNFFYSIPITPI